MIYSKLSPLLNREATELIVQGQFVGCPTSRQGGESMTSDVDRRHRWWKLVQQLDTSVVLGDSLPALGLCVECANVGVNSGSFLRPLAGGSSSI